MKALLVSDLHSNEEALRAVMNRVRRKRFDRIICLGDFVGYGAQPNQVLDRMRTFRARKLYIRGNHDRVAAGFDDGEAFNVAARSAALWTRDHLSGPNRKFLQGLQMGPMIHDGIAICHGSPLDEDEYVFNEYTAFRIFEYFEAPMIFFGHTHLPTVFTYDAANRRLHGDIVSGQRTVRLDPSNRYLINPGSVGQPRDRNPDASFAIFDSERLTIQFLRVGYDIQKAGDAILKAGLPRILADRLRIGC